MAPAIHAPETPLESVLFQASVYLTAALVVVPVAARLGLGSVLGYLIAGILIGPVLHLVGMKPPTCSILPNLAWC